jgi:hypothetical protein
MSLMFLSDDQPDIEIIPAETPKMVCPICGGELRAVALVESGTLEFPVQENGTVDFNYPTFFAGKLAITKTLRCAACHHCTTGDVHKDPLSTCIVTNESQNSSPS